VLHDLVDGDAGEATSIEERLSAANDPRSGLFPVLRRVWHVFSCSLTQPMAVAQDRPTSYETGSDHRSEETTNMPRTAKCLCGAFSVIVSAEPMMVNVRHCQDCQRRSGAPWSSSAYFPKETVHLDGPNKIYTRTSDAGTRINHHSARPVGQLFVGPERQAPQGLGSRLGHLTIRHSPPRRYLFGKKDDTHGRLPWKMWLIGTRNRLLSESPSVAVPRFIPGSSVL